MNDLFNQIEVLSRGPWFTAGIDAAACVVWGALTYFANRRGVVNFGRGFPKLRRDENPTLFERWIGAGIALTVVTGFSAVGQVIAKTIGS
jgi:hypothetical protein